MNPFWFEKDRRKKDITKSVRNVFKLRKDIHENMIKDKRNNFELKGGNGAMKGRIIRDIRNLFLC